MDKKCSLKTKKRHEKKNSVGSNMILIRTAGFVLTAENLTIQVKEILFAIRMAAILSEKK